VEENLSIFSPHPAFYSMDNGSFGGLKQPEREVDHPTDLEPRLKREYSYTSTTPSGLRGQFEGDLYL
jgi:hypothetical protein